MIFLPPKIHGRRIPWKSWGKFFSRTRHVVSSVLLPLIQGFHHANTALARSAQMPARRCTSPIISCGVGWMLQRLFSTRRNIKDYMCSNKWILLIISMLCSLLKIKITTYVVLKIKRNKHNPSLGFTISIYFHSDQESLDNWRMYWVFRHIAKTFRFQWSYSSGFGLNSG